MSCSLHWKPSGNGERVNCGSALRDAIGDEFGRKCTLDHHAIAFLRGLAAAKIEGARELIDAIETHGAIDVWQEC